MKSYFLHNCVQNLTNDYHENIYDIYEILISHLFAFMSSLTEDCTVNYAHRLSTNHVTIVLSHDCVKMADTPKKYFYRQYNLNSGVKSVDMIVKKIIFCKVYKSKLVIT
jgi:hypothetical protein